MKRRTFTAHWILCLVCLGVFSFAWRYGVPQLVYQSDHSMMTSAIAVLVVVTAAWLGWQAWEIDSVSSFMRKYPGGTLNGNADFGHLAESLAVKLGLIGTGVGVMMTLPDVSVMTFVGVNMTTPDCPAPAADRNSPVTVISTQSEGVAGMLTQRPPWQPRMTGTQSGSQPRRAACRSGT